MSYRAEKDGDSTMSSPKKSWPELYGQVSYCSKLGFGTKLPDNICWVFPEKGNNIIINTMYLRNFILQKYKKAEGEISIF